MNTQANKCAVKGMCHTVAPLHLPGSRVAVEKSRHETNLQ